MSSAFPADKDIGCLISFFRGELLKRYGLPEGCTRGQFAHTVSELRVHKEMVPYLSAVFLSDEEFQLFEADHTDVNWEEVGNRAERIFEGLQHTTHPSSHFYESWIGVHGS